MKLLSYIVPTVTIAITSAQAKETSFKILKGQRALVDVFDAASPMSMSLAGSFMGIVTQSKRTTTKKPSKPPKKKPSKSPQTAPGNTKSSSQSKRSKKSTKSSPSSEDPSENPSKNPSVSPSPSEYPSVSTSPSEYPSVSTSPSEHPSVSTSPSEHPSVSPSKHPSVSPSEHPSVSPSEHPSESSSPSEHPSESSSPSEDPSESPSEYPSVSTSPSSSPTCGVAVIIPDNNAAGAIALQEVALPPNEIITRMRVTLDMTHTWISDMIINLKAPNGKVLNLFNKHGFNGDNLVDTIVSSASITPFAGSGAPFTGTYAATAAQNVGPTNYASNVTSFNDLYSVPNGDWELAMRDFVSQDVGTLTNWKMSFDYTIPPNPSSTTAEFRYCDTQQAQQVTEGVDATLNLNGKEAVDTTMAQVIEADTDNATEAKAKGNSN